MTKVTIYTGEGKESSSTELNPALFEAPINLNCVRESLSHFMSNQRLGTACAKTRREVRGGGAKPWRQKGTGRARAGSNRSPLWKGGAVLFGPLPRDYHVKINRKKQRIALCSALTSLAQGNKVYVLEDVKYPKPQTKAVISLLDEMGIREMTLMVLGEVNDNFLLSCRNIPYLTVIRVENINIYDLINNDSLILTQSALKKLEEIMG
ncbi:50S ribosomal protein L4 [Candidatus Sumerlaeota bacterium]|nr:50S ribosomal protein L4 [Candidatus Sumerlaeota bacterium]